MSAVPAIATPKKESSPTPLSAQDGPRFAPSPAPPEIRRVPLAGCIPLRSLPTLRRRHLPNRHPIPLPHILINRHRPIPIQSILPVLLRTGNPKLLPRLFIDMVVLVPVPHLFSV